MHTINKLWEKIQAHYIPDKPCIWRVIAARLVDVLDRLERRGSTSSKEPKSTPEADGEHDFKSIKGRLDDPFLSILTSVSPTRVGISVTWKKTRTMLLVKTLFCKFNFCQMFFRNSHAKKKMLFKKRHAKWIQVSTGKTLLSITKV